MLTKSINDIIGMSAVDLAVKIEEKDEGFREKPYYDTKQIPTYGHGFVCGVRYGPLPDKTITLSESLERLRGLSEVNEKTMLRNPDLFKAYKNCNEVQRATLLSMAHQLGIYGLLQFKGMLAALYRSDFDNAAFACMDSLAARKDAPARFARNAYMLRTGVLHDYYV